jgi:hypothetical protein
MAEFISDRDLLGDFNIKLGMKDIFKARIEN